MTTISVEKSSTDFAQITAKLFATLDEAQFFGDLSKYLMKSLGCQKANVFILNENNKLKQVISSNRKCSKLLSYDQGLGHIQHVVKTKRPYFSNNTGRDPLFCNSNIEESSILIIPVMFDGVIISIISLLSSEKEFNVEDMTYSISILNELERPISNMKMYLTAQNLNAALLKRIEETEKELARKDKKSTLEDSFILKEEPFIYESAKLKEVVEFSDKISSSEVSIHISGQSGTGKESFAKRLHLKSSRKDRPFLILDCSTVDSKQIEMDLFGKASTIQDPNEKMGLLEIADKGALLIKNIDKLSFPIQTRLAEFIKNKRTNRVGATIPYKSDVRIISTSKEDLEKLVLEGNYREDLYYLLSTVSIRIPELKERPEDIEALANYFINHNKAPEKQKSLSPCLIRTLKEYDWEGNVRELKNIVEKAYFKSTSIVIDKDQLPPVMFSQPKEEKKEEENLLSAYSGMTLGDLERVYICNTLNQLDGNKTKTAKVLGITVKTLYNKLHSYGMIAPKQD